MRRVRWDIRSLPGPHDRFCAAKGDLNLAFKNRERLIEVVPMGRRPAAGRNVHINQAVATSGIPARQKDRVRVANDPQVGQSLIFFRSGNHKIALEIIEWNCGGVAYVVCFSK